MEEEKYSILSDLKKIEYILTKMRLEDGRVRKNLARLLYNRQVFVHEIGMMFIRSLTQESGYNRTGYQASVLKEMLLYVDILNRCRLDSMDEAVILKHRLDKANPPVFQTWVGKSAVDYVDRYLNYQKEKLCEEANKDLNHDLAVIRRFSSKYAFDREADANLLYGVFLQNKGRLFKSWIGSRFAEEIQKSTTKYRLFARRRKILRRTALVCIAAAVLLLVPILFFSMQNYRNGLRAQSLEAIRNQAMEGAAGNTEAFGIGASETTEQTKELTQEEKEDTQETSPPRILNQYRELCVMNPDMVGWLKLDGLQISLPVLQSTDDEDFYLTHNFYREPEKRGALFIDAASSIYPASDNIVIYGHNMNDKTMFGALYKYEKKSFYLENPVFTFDTIYETENYEIAAVVKTRILKKNEESFRYYRFYDYENEESFQEFADFIKDNQLYETGVDISFGDRFVILSTCEYSVEQGRLLVIGKKSA